MKKTRLEVEYSFDFILLGITSSAKGYRLAWEINRQLDIRLAKQQDHQVPNKSRVICSYSHFCFSTSLNTVRLFRNKPSDSKLSKWALVPEYPHFDYIVMVKSGEDGFGNRLQQSLRNIPSIEWVAFLPLGALKAKENFIF